MKNKTSNQNGFILPIVIIFVLFSLGLYAYQTLKIAVPAGKTATILTKPNTGIISNLLGQKPTKAQPAPMILTAKTSKTLNLKTGAAGIETTTFSARDPVIYVAIQVNKPVLGTKFEYVRYLNGKLVDHKSLATTRPSVEYVSFSWKLKDAKSKHLAGSYRVKLYTNGNFEKEVSYLVK